MPQGPGNPSKGPRSNPAENGVLNRVLGNLRHDAPEKDKQDAAWIQNYQITHSPDRPSTAERKSLQRPHSTELFDRLAEIWEANKVEAKAKAAMDNNAAAGRSTGSGSQGQRSRRDEHNDNHSNSAAREARTRAPPGRQANMASRSGHSRTGSNPHDYTITSRHTVGKDETVTIKVGIHMRKEELRGSSKNPSGAGTGGANRNLNGHQVSVSTSTSTSHSSTRALAGHSRSRSAPHVPPPPPEKVVRREPLCPPPRAPGRAKSTTPAATKREVAPTNTSTSKTQTRALHESMASLYVNTSRDSSPGLTQTSLPDDSERASPLTPTNVALHADERDVKQPSPETSICPLCRTTLLTNADKKQNLCGECRVEPRKSTFADPRSSSSDSYTSLISDSQPYSPAEVKGENTNRSEGSQSVDKASYCEFKLQAVPAHQKHARKVPQPGADAPAAFARESGNSRRNHDGFELDDIRQPASRPAPPGASSKMASGPTLLPKVYCAINPVPRWDKESSIAKQGQLELGPRATQEAIASRARPSVDASARPDALKITKSVVGTRPAGAQPTAAETNIDKVCRETMDEIDSIIECYRQLGEAEDAKASSNTKKKDTTKRKRRVLIKKRPTNRRWT